MAATIVVSVAAADVSILREMAHAEVESFKRSVDSYTDQERAEQLRMSEEPARMLDALSGKEGPRQVRVLPEYLRGLLGAQLEYAVGELERQNLAERRTALRRIQACVRVYEALEAGEQ